MNLRLILVLAFTAVSVVFSYLLPTSFFTSLLLIGSVFAIALSKDISINWKAGSLAALLVGIVYVLIAFPRGKLAFYALLGVLVVVVVQPFPRILRIALGIALFALAVPLAGFQNTFIFELAIQIGIFSALALGLNVVVGMAGLLDLGFAAFFAIGAYTWGIFGSGNAANNTVSQASKFIPGFPQFGLDGNFFYLFMFFAIFTAAITGVIIGLPALRLRGDYLAVVTLGLGEVVRVLANNLDRPANITNGPQGISPVVRPHVEWIQSLFGWLEPIVGRPINLPMAYNIYFYLLVLAIIGVVMMVNVRLGNSRFGRAWIAIREDEIAAKAMGIPLLPTKLIAFATGASFSGIMGAVYSAKQQFVNPESFTLTVSIFIMAMVILGGAGNIVGAVVGAAAVTTLNIEVLKTFAEYLNQLRQSGTMFLGYNFANLPTQLDPAKFERFVFGLILILMMIFRPEGLIPEKRHLAEAHKEENA